MSAPPPRTPDDLLKWSIAAQNASGQTTDGSGQSMHDIAKDVAEGRRPDLADPGLYNALMGKSEATMMQEELASAMDLSRSESDRVKALDNFEMLIEQIDNANNIKSMKMWEPLLSLLSHEHSTPAIQHATLWIIGTAVQNNDKAQMAVLDHDPLPPLLSLLKDSSDGEVRSKAMYALSGILKHNPKAVDLFCKADGWAVLKGALLDSNVSLRRKAAFFVNAMLLQDDSAEASAEAAPPISTATSTTPSRPAAPSTAIAPVSTTSSTLPDAPLEQLPATLRSGVAHPSIPPYLLSSHLLDILIVSLLSASIQATLPPTILDNMQGTATVGGPDGDIELRSDVDFAEKGCQTCFTFVEKVREQGGLQHLTQDKEALTHLQTLLSALQKELQSSAIEDEGPRWQELGFTSTEVDTFHQSMAALYP